MLTGVKIESMPGASSTAARNDPLYLFGRHGLLGFTLIELMVSISIIGILIGIALPFYISYRERARVAVAISDMKAMELVIFKHAAQQGTFPESLAQIGLGRFRDPWGFTYRYLRIYDAPKTVMGSTRKDHFMVPVNSDFDLYSVGRDGASQPAFAAKPSQDDVVRAFNGAYYGTVVDM